MDRLGDAPAQGDEESSSCCGVTPTVAAPAAVVPLRRRRISRDFTPDVWELIATFSAPRAVCDIEQLCRASRAAVSAASTGVRVLQRYWNVRWHALVHECDGKSDAKRHALLVPLSKTDGKKCWKEMYREEWEAWCRRNLRGAGCSNARAAAAATNGRNVGGESREETNAGLQRATHDGGAAEQARVAALQKRSDAAFVAMCVDGGLDTTHFGGGECAGAAVTRAEYRADARKGQRKGKHQRGKANVWAEWVGDD